MPNEIEWKVTLGKLPRWRHFSWMKIIQLFPAAFEGYLKPISLVQWDPSGQGSLEIFDRDHWRSRALGVIKVPILWEIWGIPHYNNALSGLLMFWRSMSRIWSTNSNILAVRGQVWRFCTLILSFLQLPPATKRGARKPCLSICSGKKTMALRYGLFANDFLHRFFFRLAAPFWRTLKFIAIFCGEVCESGIPMSSREKKPRVLQGGCWCLLEQRSHETCYPCWSPKLLKFFFGPWANSPFLNLRSTLPIFFLQHLENDSFFQNKMMFIFECPIFLQKNGRQHHVCTMAGHLGRRCLVSWRVVMLRRSWSLFIQLV